MDARVLQLSLLLAAEDAPESTAYFGSVLQDQARVDPQTWMADSLGDPAGYYRRLAEAYEADHNYARALEAYRQALDYAPHSTEIMSDIERLREWIADMEQ
jgi:tetratricopeptide (TPR) repeat protein